MSNNVFCIDVLQLKLLPREGTESDKCGLEKCLKDLGFAVWTYEDATYGEMFEILNEGK